MTRRMVRIAAVTALFALAAVPKSAAQIKIIRPEEVFIPVYIYQPFVDPRPGQLDKFFQKRKCPYADSKVYIGVADRYALDFRLLPALSVIEQSCGKSAPNNNLFGYYGSGKYGLREFSTIAEGVDYVGRQLVENKFYKGKTLKQKLKIYNSVNPNYYSTVERLMSEISGEVK